MEAHAVVEDLLERELVFHVNSMFSQAMAVPACSGTLGTSKTGVWNPLFPVFVPEA
jgi:hypothetical protein